jgi:hypothetical protein
MAPSDRHIAALRDPAPDGSDPAAQSSITGPLLLDLLEWLAAEPRRYAETMEAWRTSCPRLPIWEEAVARGFVERERSERAATVVVTDSGRDFLRRHRP